METTTGCEVLFCAQGEARSVLLPRWPPPDQGRFPLVVAALDRLLKFGLPHDPPGSSKDGRTTRIGLAAWAVPGEIEAQLRSLDRADCARWVAWGCNAFSQDRWQEWLQQLPKDLAGQVTGCCGLVGGFELAPLLGELRSPAGGGPAYLSRQSELGRVLEARHLYRHLARFGHGGEVDITNAFLAPARILAQTLAAPHAACSEQNEAVHAFFRGYESLQAVKDFGPIVNGVAFQEGLGRELREAWGNVDKAVRGERWKEVGDSAYGLMGLLTRVRALAGEKPSTHSRGTASGTARPINSATAPPAAGPPYRILVIDDNASDWETVYQVLAQRLGAGIGGPVAFEFSTDAATVTDESGSTVDLWQVLPDYDAILVDIYLPCPEVTADADRTKPYGLAIVERIRKRLMRLPVIVWTSSMQADLPASANLANGFLFKKDTSLDTMAQTLRKWLAQGRGTRGFSLLNPFFDHVIQTPQFRAIAVGFTQWALKVMDGLHGLDQCYFRYFNDHGGRHLNGVLCNLEKLIRPVLFLTGENAVFSADETQRERETLWLYVATLCHDTGMFPLPCEDVATMEHRPDLLRDARSAHALRVLALLNCPCLKTPPPSAHAAPSRTPIHVELNGLVHELESSGDAGADRRAVSLIAAYHSRSNKLEFNSGMLSGSGTGDGDCSTCCMKKARKEDVQALAKLYARAVNPAGSGEHRLGSMGALLRMADGLDIDFTRLPAAHILQDPGRSIKDDCENFKRQVLERIDISQGRITLVFRLPAPASGNSIAPREWGSFCRGECKAWAKVVGEVRAKFVAEELRKRGRVDRTAVRKSATEFNRAVLREVLATGEAVLRQSEGQGPAVLQGPSALHGDFASRALDGILEDFFNRSARPQDCRERLAIAIVAALTVCGEVRERYEGIRDANLDGAIKIPGIAFQTAALDSFTILTHPPPYAAREARECRYGE